MPKLGRVAAVVAVLVLVVAGCGDDDASAPPTTRRPTTTTDPFAVPDPIDAAYVERVMAELNGIYGDAARLAKKEQALGEEFKALLRAVYATDEALDVALDTWEAEEADGFANLADKPGDPRTRVQSLLLTRRDCIVASVDRDRSPLLKVDPGTPPEQLYVVLVPLDASRDPARVNRTGWALALDGFLGDQSVPGEEQCVAP